MGGGTFWVKFTNLRLVLGTAFKCYSSAQKRVKTKIQNVFRDNFYLRKSYRTKSGRVRKAF